MVELVSIFSEEICVGLAAGAWCDESEIIFAGKEDILKSLVVCYRTRSFLSRVSSVFVEIVKASNWSAHSGALGRTRAHSGAFGRIRERAEDQTCMKTSKHWLVFWGNCFRHQGRKKSSWKDKNIIMPWNWHLLSTQIYHFFFQKPAFASHSATSTGDLGSFFRECQTAPPLSLFEDNEVSSLDNIMVSLTIWLQGVADVHLLKCKRPLRQTNWSNFPFRPVTQVILFPYSKTLSCSNSVF